MLVCTECDEGFDTLDGFREASDCPNEGCRGVLVPNDEDQETAHPTDT